MNRRVVLAVVGGALAIIALWWFAIYSPKRSATASAKSERAAAEARGRDLEVTVARLKELDRNRPQTEADLRALNAAIPATPDLATFILSANEIASQAGVDFLSIAPSPPAQAAAVGQPTSIGLSIQVRGDFFAVVDYLNRLEQLERIVVVDTVNLASQGGAGAGAAGATGTGTSDPNALAVTLAAQMYTRAAPAGATGSTGVTGTTGSTGVSGASGATGTTTTGGN